MSALRPIPEERGKRQLDHCTKEDRIGEHRCADIVVLPLRALSARLVDRFVGRIQLEVFVDSISEGFRSTMPRFCW